MFQSEQSVLQFQVSELRKAVDNARIKSESQSLQMIRLREEVNRGHKQIDEQASKQHASEAMLIEFRYDSTKSFIMA